MVASDWRNMKIFIFFAINLSHFVSSRVRLKSPTVILISFDGFRHDYISREKLTNFQNLADAGVYSPSGMKSAFVTKTFPNHFTMVTGLYEESHGIVSNRMYDPVYEEYFSPRKGSYEPKWWNSTVPIWIENELIKHSDNRTHKSATVFWPGSYVPYLNHTQYYVKTPYDDDFPNRERFDIITNLLLEDDPPNFITCYFSEPDGSEHKVGTHSPLLSAVLRNLDALLGEFIGNLSKHGLYHQVDLMLVSDHGMASIEPKNVLYLSDYGVDSKWFDLIYYGTFLSIRPLNNHKQLIYEKLKAIPHLKTFLKKDIPEWSHYRNNRRVMDIFALAEEGYYFLPNRSIPAKNHTFGNHGYNNSLSSMRGIFIAHGPHFQKGLDIDDMDVINLYELMCHILKIVPHPNNGSLSSVSYMLSENNHNLIGLIKSSTVLTILVASAGGLLGLIAVGLLVTCICHPLRRPAYSRIDAESVPLESFVDDEDDEDIVEYDKSNALLKPR